MSANSVIVLTPKDKKYAELDLRVFDDNFKSTYCDDSCVMLRMLIMIMRKMITKENHKKLIKHYDKVEQQSEYDDDFFAKCESFAYLVNNYYQYTGQYHQVLYDAGYTTIADIFYQYGEYNECISEMKIEKLKFSYLRRLFVSFNKYLKEVNSFLFLDEKALVNNINSLEPMPIDVLNSLNREKMYDWYVSKSRDGRSNSDVVYNKVCLDGKLAYWSEVDVPDTIIQRISLEYPQFTFTHISFGSLWLDNTTISNSVYDTGKGLPDMLTNDCVELLVEICEQYSAQLKRDKQYLEPNGKVVKNKNLVDMMIEKIDKYIEIKKR